MECSICCECILKDWAQPYKCLHTFHSSCINKWDGSCPNCRAMRHEKQKNIYFHRLYNSMKINELCISKYKHTNYTCTDKGHVLKVCRSGVPPFGAMVFCFDCESVKCCNYFFT